MPSASKETTRAATWAGASAALSLALHGAVWASIAHPRRPPVHEPIEIEVVRRGRPKAEPPARAAAPEKPRRAARQVALSKPLPPPPLASAPPDPPVAAKTLPRVGVALGSTVASGGFAVGVGNTTDGRAEEQAADPNVVRRLSGGVVAAARLSSQPRPLQLPRIDYPPDARKAGIEGRVVLVLALDARGAVTAVRVVEAPAPSLADAAAEGARLFRFSPALYEGEPVATEIRFTYTFLLE